MESLSEPIRNEYRRWRDIVAGLNDHASASTLGVQDVLRAHFLIADEFYLQQEGLGGIGPKSVDLLFSAVNRQHTRFGSVEKWTTDFERCATLLYGLVKDHPFHDANKRTALLCALYHLDKVGRRPMAAQREFEDLVVEVADNGLGRRLGFEHWVKQFGPDAEVKFVAEFFRKNTQAHQSDVRTITYRDLNTILMRFGYSLERPDKNFIDVVRWDIDPPLLGFIGKPKRVARKQGQIGFPGWKNQVSKRDLKLARQLSRTDGPRGVDSASFYSGVDTIPALIQSYWEPLRRLAGR